MTEGMEKKLEEMFIREGIDPATARIAAFAANLSPQKRTEAQQAAVEIAGDTIAENCRKLAQEDDEASTKDLTRPGADFHPTTRNES